MNSYVLGFKDIGKSKIIAVGGKGANLGELSRISGIQVLKGFCVTTEAYKKIIEHNDAFNALLDQLSNLKVEDQKKSAKRSARLSKRQLFQSILQ